MLLQDYRESAAQQLEGWRGQGLPPEGGPTAAASQEPGGGASPPPPPLPVLGVLKLTPEKGCSIIHALARRLEGRARFLVVSGDPAVPELFAGMPHVKVRTT